VNSGKTGDCKDRNFLMTIRHLALKTIVLASLGGLLSGCDFFVTPPLCKDYFSGAETPGFAVSTDGLARHEQSGTTWYRCPAGMTYAASRCRGEMLRSTWDEAMAYTEEFSAASGRRWRLPTNRELRAIQEKSCRNPSINHFVFPAIDVANHWTSSDSLHNDSFRCAVYTFQGDLSCRESRSNTYPFLLLLD
jgi:hypothetical protein